MRLPVVCWLVGHTQASTTRRHTHVDIDPALAAADRIGATIAEAVGQGRS